MLVPPAVENPFRAHYRELILGSALRIAETELDRLHSSGHAWRARRAERVAGRLRGLTGPPVLRSLPAPAQERWFGGSLRRLVRVAWVAAAGLLLVDVVSFGVRSWTTTAADLALIVVTAVWFGVSIDDLVPAPEPRPQQLELFE
jgi:hypothetical protein